MTTSTAGRRRVLMRKDPHCWYCGIEVSEYSGTDVNGDPIRGWIAPADQATVEHRFSRSRWNERRRVILPCPFDKDDQTVLACKECNEMRGWWGDALLWHLYPDYDNSGAGPLTIGEIFGDKLAVFAPRAPRPGNRIAYLD